MTDFKREWRYIVVKRKHITEDQEAQLISLTNSFNLPNLECAVVESDWPEYETVWKMVEDRVTGRSTQPQADAAVAVELLKEVAETACVGYGDKPVARSKRVNISAALFHRIIAAIRAGAQP